MIAVGLRGHTRVLRGRFYLKDHAENYFDGSVAAI